MCPVRKGESLDFQLRMLHNCYTAQRLPLHSSSRASPCLYLPLLMLFTRLLSLHYVLQLLHCDRSTYCEQCFHFGGLKHLSRAPGGQTWRRSPWAKTLNVPFPQNMPNGLSLRFATFRACLKPRAERRMRTDIQHLLRNRF